MKKYNLFVNGPYCAVVKNFLEEQKLYSVERIHRHHGHFMYEISLTDDELIILILALDPSQIKIIV